METVSINAIPEASKIGHFEKFTKCGYYWLAWLQKYERGEVILTTEQMVNKTYGFDYNYTPGTDTAVFVKRDDGLYFCGKLMPKNKWGQTPISGGGALSSNGESLTQVLAWDK